MEPLYFLITARASEVLPLLTSKFWNATAGLAVSVIVPEGGFGAVEPLPSYIARTL